MRRLRSIKTKDCAIGQSIYALQAEEVPLALRYSLPVAVAAVLCLALFGWWLAEL
ncbi:MAG: hypothetical protein IT530_02230 [Burkholderiales bacterium]|nr:hypothetical protein [Burkholderiales bacterium]